MTQGRTDFKNKQSRTNTKDSRDVLHFSGMGGIINHSRYVGFWTKSQGRTNIKSKIRIGRILQVMAGPNKKSTEIRTDSTEYIGQDGIRNHWNYDGFYRLLRAGRNKKSLKLWWILNINQTFWKPDTSARTMSLLTLYLLC